MALNYADLLARYPRSEGETMREAVADRLRANRMRIVVIDDDPTGIQTVHGCLLLTDFSAASVAAAMDDEAPFFYMLANSRALTEAEARRIVREAVEAVLEANRSRHYNLLFVSRSDSTLRGHFPAEPDTITEVLREQGFAPVMPLLFVPSFFEAGRMTIEGVHYMQQGEQLIPVSETEFANDNVFGYRHSRLTEYMVEKGHGSISPDEVAQIDLPTLRVTEPAALAELLRSYADKRCVAVDSFDYADLRRLSLAVLSLFDGAACDRCAVIRSSSSLPKALSGIGERPYVSASTNGGRGVVVVGSHVKKSTEQLNRLLEAEGVEGIEIDVQRILDGSPTLQTELLDRAAALFAAGRVPVFYTSRREVRCDDAARRQALGGMISHFLVELVRALPFRPDFLVSKGGITSHDILTHSLGVHAARVEGQVAAGIPTIRTGADDRFPDLLYVIFPGNVGSPDLLREVVERLRG